MKHLKLFAILSMLMLPLSLGAQVQDVVEGLEKQSGSVVSDVTKLPDAQLAMSVSYYPVTAGDVYTLAFAINGSAASYTIPVDSTYKIRIANLGVINCAGLSYLQLKSQVESLVLRNYPMSGVQFVLSSPSTFLVTITGEVGKTRELNAWALTRLSNFVHSNLTSYASLRNVVIESAGGKRKTYDLFKAFRNGDLSQDPFLHPGDKIIINRYGRKISISGAVERPGTYELLPGENLNELIAIYGNGLTEYADTSRITLRRQNNSKNPSGDTIYLESEAISKNYKLEDADSITISSRIELRDTMFFEGAVGAVGRESQLDVDGGKLAESGENTKPVINRIPVTFMEGENIATLVRRNSGRFFPTSDLRNAYIIRNDQKLLINLEDCLYKRDYMSDFVAQKDDTLYVPYMQTSNTVLLIGEVNATVEIEAWPLKRLSTIVGSHLTSFSSLRNIEVTAVDGTKTVYDLFLANRYGDMSQNPYIRGGETVTVSRLDRKVTISGAVERPGTYELLEGENLKTLIEKYGNNLTEYADISRITLRRQNNSKNPSGDTIYLESDVVTKDYVLENADSITISSRIELRDTMFFEGAVGAEGKESQLDVDGGKLAESGENTKPVINRIPVTFMEGENIATLVRRNSGRFFPTSDLRNAYIIRDNQKLRVNLEDCLYKRDYMSAFDAQKDDTLFVPYMQNTDTVLLIGEVKTTVEIEAWPLKRLSTIIGGNITEFSSTRNIEVTAVDGTKTVYDLFLAARYGDMSQNPYIRGGETVTVSRLDRKVTISGAIERPGTYELLPGENLKELVHKYGGGLVPLADVSRIELYRTLAGSKMNGEKTYLDESSIDNNMELLCYDSVLISSYKELQSVVYIEGAVNVHEVGDTTSVELEGTTKLTYTFIEGEDYAYFIRRHRNMFIAESDLTNSYLIRGEETIPMNLAPMLYDASYTANVKIEPYDTIIIPFRQYFVSVAGAVKNPGRFPYIPNRTWDYYIGLAGGFDTDKNTLEAIEMVDVNGKKLSKKEFVKPETTITAKTNSIYYKFNRYAPFLTTLLSVISTTLSIMAVTGAL